MMNKFQAAAAAEQGYRQMGGAMAKVSKPEGFWWFWKKALLQGEGAKP